MATVTWKMNNMTVTKLTLFREGRCLILGDELLIDPTGRGPSQPIETGLDSSSAENGRIGGFWSFPTDGQREFISCG